jgi:hypothetical protein
MRTARVAAVAVTAAALAGCAVFNPQPPHDCFDEGHLPQHPWTAVAPAELAADIERLERLVDDEYGPRSGERQTWFRGPNGEVRLCRWSNERCAFTRYGSWYEFDLSGAEPDIADSGGTVCLT